jgi:hypothetical protein
VPATGAITLTLDAATRINPVARVFVETTTKTGRPYTVTGAQIERGGYTVPLRSAPIEVSLAPR